MFLRRASHILSRIIISSILVIPAGCGKDSTGSTAPAGYACSGTPAQCLRLGSGWTFDGMIISNPGVADVTVVRLTDGRYRIYGGEGINPGTNQRVYHSYVSAGAAFQEEAG